MGLSLLRHATRRCLEETVTHNLVSPVKGTGICGHLCRRYPLNLLKKGFHNRAIHVRLQRTNIYCRYPITEREHY